MASDESMGGFGSGMIWIFGIIVLLALLNGNFLGGGNNQTATRDQVQGSFEYSNLLDGNRDIMTAVNSGTAQAVPLRRIRQSMTTSTSQKTSRTWCSRRSAR